MNYLGDGVWPPKESFDWLGYYYYFLKLSSLLLKQKVKQLYSILVHYYTGIAY